MAGNSIGSGVVTLSANADGLASGLAKSSTDFDRWGTGIASQAHKIAADTNLAIGKIGMNGPKIDFGKFGGQAGHTIKLNAVVGQEAEAGVSAWIHKQGAKFGAWGQIISGALAIIPGILGAGFEFAEARLNKFGAISKRADVLGVKGSDLMGMDQLLARVGVEAEAVNGVFAKMGKNILQSGSAAKALSSMGIAPADIKDKSLTDQFKMIADGLNKLPKGAQQAAAAMDLFGKSGAQLLPMLQRGGAGIDEFIAHQKKMGAVLSDGQLKAAGDAAKAWKIAKVEVSAAWDGLMNRAAMLAAPLLAKAGQAISKMMAIAEPYFSWLGRGLNNLAEIGTIAFDGIGEGINAVVDGVKEFASGLGDIGAQMPTHREVVIGMFRAIGTAGGYAWDVIAKGMGYVAIGIGKIVEGFGVMIGKFNDVAKAMGLPTILTGTERIGKSIGEWGEKMAGRRFGQAADDFNNWLDKKLKKLAEKPPITGGLKGLGETGGAEEWQPAKLAGAFERGSKEAYSLEMKTRYGGDFGAAENVHKENGKKQDKANDTLKKMLEKMNGIELKIGEVESF